MLEYRIDVSEFQDNIDWTKVKADGIDFAMVRAGSVSYTHLPRAGP